MGLDIVAYSGLKKVDVEKKKQENKSYIPEDEELYFHVTDNAAKDIDSDAFYEAKESYSFRAGSYSGYNDWREELAKIAGYPSSGSSDTRHQHSITV